MKSRPPKLVTIATTGLLVCLVTARPATAGPDAEPRTVILETLGGQQVFTYSINNDDIAAGSIGGTTARAAKWDRNGRITLLADAPGTSDSAYLINDRGVTAGFTGVFGARWDRDGRVTVLENPGAEWHQLRAINNRNEIVGYMGMPGYLNLPVRWNADGQVARLEMLPGAYAGIAHDINDDGVAVGELLTESGQYAVRWDRDGEVTELPSPGNGINVAMGVNKHGRIAGTVQETFPSTPILPARWDRGDRLVQLSVPDGTMSASTHSINDNGTVAGEIGLSTSVRTVRWNRDAKLTVLDLPPGHESSFFTAMNDRDVAVGNSTGPVGSSGVFWDREGRVHELAPLRGHTYTGAMAINDMGSVLGSSGRAGSGHAVVWRNIARGD